jgi:signal transduction histidine kinase
LYSIIPLVFLSFLGGYGIASFSLKPLEDLSKKMKEKSTENLDEEIQFIDNQDEISELIKSFNRMNSRLNKSFEAQKEFVENASHELKTPLSIIQANLDTALEDKKISKEELEELLRSSEKSVGFMNTLIEDLLLLSLLDQDIELEDVEVVNLVKDSIEEIKTMSNNDIKINAVFSKNKIVLKANSVLLKRAVMNILENAVKYSECDKITVSVKEKRDSAKIVIKDNGKGIPKQELKRIFDRFYRVDKSRSRKTGGSGLGLSITKKIVQRFGGTISVDSSLGKGSQFTINLPVVKEV